MIQRRSNKNGGMEVDLNNGTVSRKGEQTTQGHYSGEKTKQNKTHSRGTASRLPPYISWTVRRGGNVNASGRFPGSEKLDQHFLRAASSDASPQSGKINGSGFHTACVVQGPLPASGRTNTALSGLQTQGARSSEACQNTKRPRGCSSALTWSMDTGGRRWCVLAGRDPRI